MAQDKGHYMPRISNFDEMPYDDALLNTMRLEGDAMDPGPQRDAYRVIMTTITMDLHRGGVLRGEVVKTLLREANQLADDAERIVVDDEDDLKEKRTFLQGQAIYLRIEHGNLERSLRALMDQGCFAAQVEVGLATKSVSLAISYLEKEQGRIEVALESLR